MNCAGCAIIQPEIVVYVAPKLQPPLATTATGQEAAIHADHPTATGQLPWPGAHHNVFHAATSGTTSWTPPTGGADEHENLRSFCLGVVLMGEIHNCMAFGHIDCPQKWASEKAMVM